MIRSQGGADVLVPMMMVMMLSMMVLTMMMLTMMMLTIHLCHVYRKLRKQRWTNRGTNTWKHSMPPFSIKGRQRQRVLTRWLGPCLLTHRPTLVCVPHRDNSFLREFLLKQPIIIIAITMIIPMYLMVMAVAVSSQTAASFTLCLVGKHWLRLLTDRGLRLQTSF